MQQIDAHMHFAADDEDAELLQALGTKVLNICIGGLDRAGWRDKEATPYRDLARRKPSTFSWCTSFRSPMPQEPSADFADSVIAQLKQDFSEGAIACKVWKNVGMEDLDCHGQFRMIDDRIFRPIFDFLEAESRPCLTHIGEPFVCWQPLDPSSPHYGYYSQHPQWHMHGRSDVPCHGDLMAARDRVLARHPKLRLIGAHLGSLEYDLKEVARRLDTYPNFAVDTSGRLADLAWKDPATVRAFFEQYQDRLLWGTDNVLELNDNNPEKGRSNFRSTLQDSYALEHEYFLSGNQVSVMNRICQGLNLVPQIADKFFGENARAWYPGM